MSVEGAAIRGLPLLGRPLFWKAVSLAALVSCVTVLAGSAGRTSLPVLFLGLPLGLQFVTSMTFQWYFDRYLLPLLPAALLLGAEALEDARRSLAVVWAAAVLVVIVAWAGAADMLRVKETSWKLGQEAVRLGDDPVRAEDLDQAPAYFIGQPGVRMGAHRGNLRGSSKVQQLDRLSRASAAWKRVDIPG